MQSIPAHPKPVIAEVAEQLPLRRQLVASCDLAFRRHGAICNAGCHYRSVLFNADGGAVAQCCRQTRDGDAVDGDMCPAPKRSRSAC